MCPDPQVWNCDLLAQRLTLSHSQACPAGVLFVEQEAGAMPAVKAQTGQSGLRGCICLMREPLSLGVDAQHTAVPRRKPDARFGCDQEAICAPGANNSTAMMCQTVTLIEMFCLSSNLLAQQTCLWIRACACTFSWKHASPEGSLGTLLGAASRGKPH